MSTHLTRITPLKQVEPPEKAAKSGKITPKQEEFLETLLLVHYISDAADRLHISERTARRWLSLPHVQQALEDLRQERRDAIRNKIETSLDLATDLLQRTLYDAVWPDMAQKAGRSSPDRERVDKYVALIVKYAHDQQEIDVLKQRIAELEKRRVDIHGARDTTLQALTDEEIEMLEGIAKRLEAVDGTIEEKD